MAKTYFEWFTETLALDQTSLVNTLYAKVGSSTLKAVNCPEYYISGYDVCLQTSEAKENFINRYIESIKKEKEILQEATFNREQLNSEMFLTSDKIKEIKECIQEIEIQTAILEIINENLHQVFSCCKWFPFNNKTLFDIFNFAKLPLVVYKDNYWLGILPDKLKYERQRKFYSVLQAYELPEDSRLIYTKLHTWVDVKYEKATVNGPLVDFEKPVLDAFRINARKIARQKIFDSWENTYVSLHNREI